MSHIDLAAFFDSATSTLSYVVWDKLSGDAVVIDPVMDYDPGLKQISWDSVRRLEHFVTSKSLQVHWILDTHVHADHLSSSRLMKQIWPGALWGMAASIDLVFKNFQKFYKWPPSVKLEDLGIDRKFRDGESFSAGAMQWSVIATPGHTPACLTYRLGGWLFTGDAIMMPDGGVGRCDFPGGSAAQLYDSVWGRIFGLQDSVQIFVGHDYQPGGRTLRYQTAVGEERVSNIHLQSSTSQDAFIAFREARDKTLKEPRLLAESMDWNLGAHQIVPRAF